MKQNSQIKTKIIETTKSLLKEQGHVTIKEIADACFINIAAVNYHFGSKDALLQIVMKDIIYELKRMLTEKIDALPNTLEPELVLSTILDNFYTYAIDNIGIINHLFLKAKTQNTTSSLLIKEFFTDSPFTEWVLEKISASTHVEDEETLKAKYMVLFSSFSIPLFIQILEEQTIHENIISLKNPSFRKKYLKELLKIIY